MTAVATRAWIGIALGMGLAGGCATARPPAPAPVSREVLPNGMRVIVQEHRAADVVALQLWIRVGARDETPDQRGFSHLVEHMLFKGTESRPRGFTDREVEGIGGRTNAATSYDYTFYYLLLPAGQAARGVTLLADMAFNARFDPDEIEREREVVFEEARLGDDNPRAVLHRRLHELAFRGHPYGYPVLGDPAALRAATRATLRDYYARHYVPENMTLVVVGAVDEGEMRAAAARAFGAAPRAGQARPAPAEPPALDRERRERVPRPERQVSSYLLAQVGTAPDSAARAEEGMRRELERIRAEGISAQELDRARAYLLGQFALDRRTNARLAWYAAFFESAGVGHDFPLRYVAAVEAVTLADVRRVARAYLASPIAVTVGPARR